MQINANDEKAKEKLAQYIVKTHISEEMKMVNETKKIMGDDSADNLRKGAALNAVQIVEILIGRTVMEGKVKVI